MFYFWPYNWETGEEVQDAIRHDQAELTTDYWTTCHEATFTIGATHNRKPIRTSRARGRVAERLIPRWLAYMLDLVTIIVQEPNEPLKIRWVTDYEIKKQRARTWLNMMPKKPTKH